jgi:hypothetical protein
MTFTDRELAQAVLDTAEKHENSWHEPRAGQVGVYALTILQAAQEVCGGNESLTLVVDLLLFHAWNDILDWANKVSNS